MTYAVIAIQGKQHKVKAGDRVVVDRLPQEIGDSLDIQEVLLLVEDDQVAVGTPVVTGQVVRAKVVEHLRGKKIRVATYKAKSRHRRVVGHRQEQSRIEIVEVGAGGTKKASQGTEKKVTKVTHRTKAAAKNMTRTKKI